jgi:hypothetical protein
MCGIIAMGPQPRRRSIKYSGRGSVPTALSLQMWLDTIATLGWSARSDGSADFLNQCWLLEGETFPYSERCEDRGRSSDPCIRFLVINSAPEQIPPAPRH